MSQMFQMDRRQFNKLLSFYKEAPKLFFRAARGVLNSFAFGVRQEFISTVHQKMTVRNRSFISLSTRAEKTKGYDLRSMQSSTNTVRRQGFSGWEEQETGRRTLLNRTISSFARGGAWTGRVRQRYRVKRSNDFFDPSRYSGVSDEHRMSKMLGAMRMGRAVKKRPFIIRRRLSGSYANLRRGIYGWRGKQIVRVQNFERPTQPKRLQIMKMARDNFFRRNNVQQIWNREIDRSIINSMK